MLPLVFTFKAGKPFNKSFADTSLQNNNVINVKIVKNLKKGYINFFKYSLIVNSFYVTQEDQKY